MHPVLLYLLKLSVGLAAVFLFYHFVLRRLTFFNWNRWYLLGYTLLCFVVPFIDVSAVLEENKWSENDMVNWVPVIRPQAQGNSTSNSISISAEQVVICVVLTGMLVMLIRLLVQFLSFRKMVRKAVYISGGEMKLYQVDENIIPFSFGNAVFINKNLHTEQELQEIIRHEFIHVRQRHSADILWSELLCLINWFNPFAWLLKKSIRQNLEFIADNKVLQNGIDRKEYQYLLLKVTGNNQYSIATPFNFSSLKKRIAMMNRLKSAKVNLLRFLFILPLLAVVLVSFRDEIQDTVTGRSKESIQLPVTDFTDTVPDVKDTNSKGYFIDIKGKNGECVVVIKDKSRREVKQLLLTEWNEKPAYYESLYGEIPPPPPPAPPKAPAVMVSDQMPAPPAPPSPVIAEGYPAPPAPPSLPAAGQWIQAANPNVMALTISNEKAIIKLKNGKSEEYDLTSPAEKKKFEEKYGKLPAQPTPPAAPLAPLKEVTVVGYKKELAATSPVQEVTVAGYRKEPAAAAPLKEITVTGYKTQRDAASPVKEVTVAGRKRESLSLAPAVTLSDNVLYVIDGQKSSASDVQSLSANLIKSVNILKNENAISKYGEAGKHGVVEINTKVNGVVTLKEVSDVKLNNNVDVNYKTKSDVKYDVSLILLDGKEISADEMNRLPSSNIESVTILKGKDAAMYGDKGKNGVIIIKSKKKTDVKPITGSPFFLSLKKDDC